MSSFAVTAEKLTILEHPNADALELAQVGGYRAVVAKGAYETGDIAIYVPEAAILPDELIDELGLTGKLAGSKKNRVKAVRLRGELSQGIVCSPTALADVDLAEACVEQTDFSERLGITKYVPEVPVHMSGQVQPAAELIRWVDIENIKRYPDLFEPGERVIATEKIHGTACLVTYLAEDDELFVTSKGYGSKLFSLTEDGKNLYWRAVRTWGVDKLAAELANDLGVLRVGVFGEVFGAGIQDLQYGQAPGQPAYASFDVAYDTGDGVTRWVDAADLEELLDGRVPRAPVLYAGRWDLDVLTELAEGTQTISPDATHLREGLVVRPERERRSDVLGGRTIAKIVSEAYLTRKGGTEYE